MPAEAARPALEECCLHAGDAKRPAPRKAEKNRPEGRRKGSLKDDYSAVLWMEARTKEAPSLSSSETTGAQITSRM